MQETALMEAAREERAVARWHPAARWYHPLLAALVARTSRFVMRQMNSFTMEGRERFDSLADRGGRGLLTFSNHVSLFDDPLLTANFAPAAYRDLRWVGADAINFFGSPWKAWIFTAGRCVPLVRGAGVDQAGFRFLRDRLAEGAWVHMCPEGGRTRDPHAVMRRPFKLGIGRLIEEARPIALPFYHYGMQDVLPVGSVRPRAGRHVRVVFGKSTACDAAFISRVSGTACDERIRWDRIAAWAYGELRPLERRLNPHAGDGQ